MHALGTPPAFILSQDQTLRLRSEPPTGREVRRGCSRRSSVALEPHEFDHPSRTDRGDGRYRGPTLHRSRLIRYPDAPRNRSEGGKPPRDGVLALAFHTLLSFQGTSPGCSSATHLRFPCPVAAGAAGTVPRAFQDRQRLPTCPVSVLLVEHHPPRRHLHTEAPPCAPDLLGVRTATEQPSDRILLAFGDPLSSGAGAAGVGRRGPRSRRASLLAAWRR